MSSGQSASSVAAFGARRHPPDRDFDGAFASGWGGGASTPVSGTPYTGSGWLSAGSTPKAGPVARLSDSSAAAAVRMALVGAWQ